MGQAMQEKQVHIEAFSLQGFCSCTRRAIAATPLFSLVVGFLYGMNVMIYSIHVFGERKLFFLFVLLHNSQS